MYALGKAAHLLPLLLIFSILTIVHSKCDKPRIRRSWYTLSDKERQLFIEALQEMKTRGLYDEFVEVHSDELNRAYAHGTSGFLAWHRWFIFIFENKIRELAPRYQCITIPYWPWEQEADREPNSPLLKTEWFGSISSHPQTQCQLDGPFSKWLTTDGGCIKRTYMTRYGYIGEAQIMSLIISYPTFGNDSHGFRSRLEGSPHAAPHHFLGGSGGHMGQFSSTNDPFFYVHHSNVDRIWSLWQDCHDMDKFYGQDRLPDVAWLPTRTGYDGDKNIMPYHWNRTGTFHPFFSRKVSPKDVYFINNPELMDYTYEPGDRIRGLLDYAYGGCNWDWFSRGDSLILQKRDGTRIISEDKTQNETTQAVASDAVNALKNALKTIGDKFKDKVVNEFPASTADQYLQMEENIAAKSIINAIRDTQRNEDKTEYSDPFWDPKTKTNIYKFVDPRVQTAYEKVLKEFPHPHVPRYHQIRMIAIEECKIGGGKPHSSEEWGMMTNMHHMKDVFHSLCKNQI